MLQMIRRAGVEQRWVYGIIMGVVIVAFVGPLMWQGLEGTSGAYAAKVNGDVVLMREYNQSYKQRYQAMERQLGDQFGIEMAEAMGLKRQVLMEMIDERLWLAFAEGLGIQVSDVEVRNALQNTPAFQVNGRFNGSHYRRVLSRVRLTPEDYEATVRMELAAARARGIIGSSARVTAADLKLSPVPGVSAEDAEARVALADAHRNNTLRIKQNQAVFAYTQYLRDEADLEIYGDVVGFAKS